MLEYVVLTVDDLPECARLFVQVFRSPPWNEPWELAAATERLTDTLNTPAFLGIKAVHGHRILGFLMAYAESYHCRKDLYLKEMCVEAESQRKGIGSGLMRTMTTVAREAGVNTIYLLTRINSPAAQFYEKCGFTTNPRVVLMSRNIHD